MIKNARVSFPALFKEPIIDGDVGKKGAKLLLDPEKNKLVIALITKTMKEIADDKLKGKLPSSDRLCLRDGNDTDREEQQGYMVLSSNTSKKIVVLGKDAHPVTEDECEIYSGCYVNAKVSLWAQNNKYGKRVNAQLVAIQFVRDGEALDGATVSTPTAMEGFEAEEETEEDAFAI